ncbi:MAG: tRNA (adenosine(37)-N6)-threonylcarbamoyltransferase complex dimerization subunit type 1 TsaB [Clostridia bacterium]|nr:tRNA (adenosine(37)-N6)-threonylcarbamoyltransferase complex dimerization subunit type 1 TsaB [Clostridia bacterium]
MKILAIDTSSEICGVALLEDEKLIDDNSLNNGKTHSENLMPLVEEILKRNNINLKDIDLIACNVGPGSFTGIRIGVALVKALAEVTKIKVAEVTSLEALSKNIDVSETKVSLIDCRNNQVYCGIFDNDNNLKEEYLTDEIGVVTEKVAKYKNITVCGNGAILHENILKEKIADIKFSESNSQIAVNTGRIGYKKFIENNLKTADTILPIYLRKSRSRKNEKKINKLT